MLSVFSPVYGIDFENDFVFPLLGNEAVGGDGEVGGALGDNIDVDFGDSYVYDFSDIIDPDKPLLDSLKNIFYPPVFGDEQTP